MSRTKSGKAARKAARHWTRKGAPNVLPYRRWTTFEMDVITHPERPTDAELGRMLGRTSGAVQVKRHELVYAGYERTA